MSDSNSQVSKKTEETKQIKKKKQICPHCSRENIASGILCQSCGNLLNVVKGESQNKRFEKMIEKKPPKAKSAKSRDKSPKMAIKVFSVAVFAVIIGGFAVYRREQNVLLQQQLAVKESKIEAKSVMASQKIEEFINKHYLQVQEMAASPFLTDSNFWSAWSTERKKEYFQNNFLANSDGMDSYVLIDAETGDTLFSGGTGTKTKNNKHLDYYKEVVKTKKPIVIPHRKSTKTGIAYTYMAAPSFDEEGKLKYIIRTRIRFDDVQRKIAEDLESLNNIFGEFPSSQFFLVDGIGKIIATENAEHLGKHINSFFPLTHELRQEELSEVRLVKKEDDSSYFVAYSPIIEQRGLPNLEWSFVLAIKDDNNF